MALSSPPPTNSSAIAPDSRSHTNSVDDILSARLLQNHLTLSPINIERIASSGNSTEATHEPNTNAICMTKSARHV